MAIIVKHLETQQYFALIGTGYGAYKATRPSLFGGSLIPHEEEGEIPVAAVCDKKGNIQWFYTKDLKVMEIDGVKTEEILAPFKEETDEEVADFSLLSCPACNSDLSVEDAECPSCGLVFQDVTEEEE